MEDPKPKKKPIERNDYEFGIQLLRGNFITVIGKNMTANEAEHEATKMREGFVQKFDVGKRLITKYNIMFVEFMKIVTTKKEENASNSSPESSPGQEPKAVGMLSAHLTRA